MPVMKICKTCGNEFWIKGSKASAAIYCSQQCYFEDKPKKEMVEKICPQCGKNFISPKTQNKTFCSRTCSNNSRKGKRYTYFCDVCGKEMQVTKYQLSRLESERQKHITCSKECSNKLKESGNEVLCANCGKPIYRIKSSQKKSENYFCCIKCRTDFNHKQTHEIRKCEICGLSFETSKKSSQRFCSQKCFGKWKTIIQTGTLNPRFKRIKMICDTCGKDIYVKKAKLTMHKNFFCSNECRQRWYAEVFSQTEEWRNYAREVFMKALSEKEQTVVIQSRPQNIVDEMLNDMGVNFIREYNIKYYCVDNYLSNFNLMIEVQGDYWHSNPLIYTDNINEIQANRIPRDKRKHTYIKNQYGIETLYLWETDICKRPDLCCMLIQEYIDNRGLLSNYHSFNYQIIDGKLTCNENTIIPYQDMSKKDYAHLITQAT